MYSNILVKLLIATSKQCKHNVTTERPGRGRRAGDGGGGLLPAVAVGALGAGALAVREGAARGRLVLALPDRLPSHPARRLQVNSPYTSRNLENFAKKTNC